MNVLETNILSIYGEKGRMWLDELPNQVQQLAALWGLSSLEPYDNLTYHYVLSGFQNKRPVVVKLGIDTVSLDKEIRALEAFTGYGAASLLEHQTGALLLQKAIPGNSLKTYQPKSGEKAIEIACKVIEKLHLAKIPKKGYFPHIEDWLTILDASWELPRAHLQTARRLKNQLIKNLTAPVLLHGDLHRDNILSDGKNWLVIDPKGVIGYPINEIPACVENPHTDLAYFSHYFNLEFDEVVKWYYIHLIMAACWQLEDRLDPKPFLDLAQAAHKIIVDYDF